MARSFDGSSYILYSAINLSGVATISVSCWYYSSSADNSFIFAHNEADGLFRGPYLKPRSSSGTLEVGCFDAGAGDFWNYNGTRPTDSMWHHVLATYDRPNGLAKVWIDSVPLSLTVSVAGSTGGNLGSATLRLGAYSGGAGMTGRIADFAIYEGLMQQGEASELSKGVSPLRVRPDKLAFYAPLEAAGGATANNERAFGRMGAPIQAAQTFSGTGAIASPFGHRAVPRSNARKAVFA